MCVCIGCARSHTIFSVLHVLKRVFMFHDWEVMKVVPEVYFFTVICSICGHSVPGYSRTLYGVPYECMSCHVYVMYLVHECTEYCT